MKRKTFFPCPTPSFNCSIFNASNSNSDMIYQLKIPFVDLLSV